MTYIIDQVQNVKASVNKVLQAFFVAGDTVARFTKDSSGKMSWGSGSGAVDCILERSAAGIMKFTTGGLRLPSIVTLSAATTLDAQTHANRLLLLTGTGSSLAQTLPAASGTGDLYIFVVGAVNTSNHVITAPSGALMYGNIFTNSTGDTPDLAQPWPADQSDDRTITLNGTTTGGQGIGDIIAVMDIATNKYLVVGFTTSSGTEATPFS